MPLIKGKSEKAFKQNIRTEMHAGKPQKQSLAIAYAMKRKAQKKKMAEGGEVKPSPKTTPTPEPTRSSNPLQNQDLATAFQKGFRGASGKYADGGKVKGVHEQVNKMHPGRSDMNVHARMNPDEAKRRSQQKLKELKEMPNPKLKGLAYGGDMKGCPKCGYAHGGQVTNDGYQSSGPGHTKPDLSFHEFDSGFLKHEGDVKRPNGMAMSEDSRKLNQHGEIEEGEQGGGEGFHGESYMGNQGNAHDEYQSEAHEEDMVGRIMKQRQMSYSEGGKVANQEHGENNNELAGFSPNEFDDLVLRDDLESHYGDDDNAGDSLDNKQEDEDRSDIVARIMASRKKKDKLPRPA